MAKLTIEQISGKVRELNLQDEVGAVLTDKKVETIIQRASDLISNIQDDLMFDFQNQGKQ